jgi:hypothetical protein
MFADRVIDALLARIDGLKQERAHLSSTARPSLSEYKWECLQPGVRDSETGIRTRMSRDGVVHTINDRRTGNEASDECDGEGRMVHGFFGPMARAHWMVDAFAAKNRFRSDDVIGSLSCPRSPSPPTQPELSHRLVQINSDYFSQMRHDLDGANRAPAPQRRGRGGARPSQQEQQVWCVSVNVRLYARLSL